jgi:hypothetical protein
VTQSDAFHMNGTPMRNIDGLKRGGPGRLAGTPNKATQEAWTFCQSLLEDADYRAQLGERLRGGNLAPGFEQLLWFYAYGRPGQTRST